MNKSPFLFRTSRTLAILATVTGGSLLALRAAEVVEDFEADPTVISEAKSHEETVIAIAEDPGKAGNHALKISWVAHTGTHVAGSLNAPGGVIAQEPGVYEVTAKVNFEQCPPEITRISLRVVDGGNETFQFVAPVDKSGEPGWQEVKWVIDTKNIEPGKSWGDRVDNVMDFPVRFYGFAFDLKDWKTQGGEVQFDDISVTRISD